MITLGAYLIGIGMPETYARAVKPRAAKYRGLPAPHIPKALSGTTFSGMLQTTVLTPLRMLVAEPIVIGISLYLGFNFAVVFSFFIAVPVVLNLIHDFTVQQSGLAFLAAIGASLVAAATTICIDKLVTNKSAGMKMVEKHGHSLAAIEYRLLPAMIGGPAITASLFWIGWEASPTTSAYSPILGTALYVWGNMSVLVSSVSSTPHLTNSHNIADLWCFLSIRRIPTQRNSFGTHHSRLHSNCACRVPAVGHYPKLVLRPRSYFSSEERSRVFHIVIQGLTGAWAYSLFGFISLALIPLPWLLFRWGPSLRAQSKYQGLRAVPHMEV